MGHHTLSSEVPVALQGALETFQLDDVLRLLGSSEKTGLLTLTGDRGVGRVWVIDGQIVQTEIEVDTNFVENDADAVFHMLRFGSGDYVFEADERPSEPADEALAMDTVLAEAEGRLDEWSDIVGVVEGLETWVRLTPTIDDEVTVEVETWERLARIGSGVTIREMGVQLAEAELSTMRAVKELVERGLADVGEAPAPLASTMSVIEPSDPVEYVAPVTEETIESDPVDYDHVASDPSAYVSPTSEATYEAAPQGYADIASDTLGHDAALEADTALEAETAGYAPVADAGIASPEADFAPVTSAGIESDPTAHEPTSDVPASWQTAAPASAWPEPQISAELPTDAEARSLEAPVEGVEPQEWSEPAAPEAPATWNAEPLAGESTWAATDEGWPSEAAVEQVSHEWDAPAASAQVAVEADRWPAPPPPLGEANAGVDPAIESLYDDDKGFDGYAEADTGAIEYGDGAFDQAAEALGWGHDVDNSPEGFWGESTPTTEPVGAPRSFAAEDASEMARRLAELSPAAARAVAQAARATTPEEREAALAAAEAEDASVDRSLLLRFLGSFDN